MTSQNVSLLTNTFVVTGSTQKPTIVAIHKTGTALSSITLANYPIASKHISGSLISTTSSQPPSSTSLPQSSVLVYEGAAVKDKKLPSLIRGGLIGGVGLLALI